VKAIVDEKELNAVSCPADRIADADWGKIAAGLDAQASE
jgi:hypothetical protein